MHQYSLWAFPLQKASFVFQSTHIVFLHRGHGGVIDPKHQGLIRRREAREATAAYLANHLCDCWEVDDAEEEVHVLRKHV